MTPRCPHCGKASFPNQDRALDAALLQAKRHGTPFATHPCRDDINRWHLTTAADRNVSSVGTVTPTAGKARPTGAGFVAAAPLLEARRHAEKELRGRATPGEVAQLHANPLLWMRALQAIRHKAETTTAKERRTLAHLKPTGSGPASPAYLAAKAEFEQRIVSRLWFEELIVQRLRDINSLLGSKPIVGWVTAGDMAETFARLVTLADAGEVESFRNLANYHAERWARQAAATDASSAA